MTHMMIVEFPEFNEDVLKRLVAAGAISFREAREVKATQGADDAELRRIIGGRDDVIAEKTFQARQGIAKFILEAEKVVHTTETVRGDVTFLTAAVVVGVGDVWMPTEVKTDG